MPFHQNFFYINFNLLLHSFVVNYLTNLLTTYQSIIFMHFTETVLEHSTGTWSVALRCTFPYTNLYSKRCILCKPLFFEMLTCPDFILQMQNLKFLDFTIREEIGIFFFFTVSAIFFWSLQKHKGQNFVFLQNIQLRALTGLK